MMSLLTKKKSLKQIAREYEAEQKATAKKARKRQTTIKQAEVHSPMKEAEIRTDKPSASSSMMEDPDVKKNPVMRKEASVITYCDDTPEDSKGAIPPKLHHQAPKQKRSVKKFFKKHILPQKNTESSKSKRKLPELLPVDDRQYVEGDVRQPVVNEPGVTESLSQPRVSDHASSMSTLLSRESGDGSYFIDADDESEDDMMIGKYRRRQFPETSTKDADWYYVRDVKEATLEMQNDAESGISSFVSGQPDIAHAGELETIPLKDFCDEQIGNKEDGVVQMLSSMETQLTSQHGGATVKDSEEPERTSSWLCCPSCCQGRSSRNPSYSEIKGSG